MTYRRYEFRSERRRCRGGGTRGTLWRVTGARSVHHHLYFGSGSWSADGRHLLFISYRTGFPNLFACEWGCGVIRRITARVDLNPFSVSPSPLRREFFFTARDEVRRVHLESLEETVLARFRGARLGNCSVDSRGERLAVSVRWPDRCGLAVVAADGSGGDLIPEKPGVTHPQFCPSDSNLLLYSRGAGRELRLIRADGTEDRLLYEAKEPSGVYHATWLGRSSEVMFVSGPGRLSAVSKDGGPPRVIVPEGIWHAASNREGAEIVADGRDRHGGILRIDPAAGRYETLCGVEARGCGLWWAKPDSVTGEDLEAETLRSETPEAERAPGRDAAETLFGPEWTHLHPVPSPGGDKVVFTSDRKGWPQVYVLERE